MRNKAKKLITNLHLGKGATDFLEKLISEAIDKPCKYCGEKITMKNMQVDHIIPLRRAKIKHNEYTEEELKVLYSKENIQIICKSCNKIKGDLTEADFIWLMDVLSPRPDVKKEVLKRMKGSGFVYRRF